MNQLTVCIVATLVAMVVADGYATGKGYRGHARGGYQYKGDLDPNYQKGLVPNAKGVVAPYKNAERQEAVNAVAHKYGTGTGTAYKDGVAGAGKVYLHNYQHGNYGYGKDSYGYRNDGYGYGHANRGYGHSNYGYGRHGDYGYDRYANQDGRQTRKLYNADQRYDGHHYPRGHY